MDRNEARRQRLLKMQTQTTDRNDARKQLLLKMYDQMFNDINRHILVVWQAVGVVIGAFAVFALVEKKIMPLDLAVALIVLLCGWMLAQLYDSAYWYNRNLVIIANIEKEFLTASDVTNIHFYFGSHRRRNKMIAHLRIQRFLAFAIAALVLGYHFLEAKIWQGFRTPMSNFSVYTALPYFALAVTFLYVNHVRNDRTEAYAHFVATSPGKDLGVPASNAPGHGMLRSLLETVWLSVRLYKKR